MDGWKTILSFWGWRNLADAPLPGVVNGRGLVVWAWNKWLENWESSDIKGRYEEIIWNHIWVFPKNRGTPKWMVYNNGKRLLKMDDLGGKTPLFLETSIYGTIGPSLESFETICHSWSDQTKSNCKPSFPSVPQKWLPISLHHNVLPPQVQTSSTECLFLNQAFLLLQRRYLESI